MVGYFKEINNQLFSTEGGQNGKMFILHEPRDVS